MIFNDFLAFLTNGILLLLGILTLFRYLEDRTTQRFDTALMFLAFAVSPVVTILNTLLPTLPSWFPTLSSIAILAQPYLLIRIVQHFHDVSLWLLRFALIGFILSVVDIVVFPEQATIITILIIAYIVILEIYSAWAFLQGAINRAGVTKQRLSLAATGSGLLGVSFIIIAMAIVSPEFADGIISIFYAFFNLSLLCYFFAFVTPSWLRQTWQQDVLYNFLQQNQSADDRVVASVAERLSIFAKRAVGAVSTLVLDYQFSHWEVIAYSDGKVAEFQTWSLPDTPILNRIFQTGQAQTVNDHQSDQCLTVFHQQFQTQTVFAVPIRRTKENWGILLVFGKLWSLFPEEDLSLLTLLAEQVGQIIENNALATEQQLLITQLQEEVKERWQAEQLVEKNSRHLSAIFDGTFQFIGLLEPNGKLLKANRSAILAAGLPADTDLAGTYFWDGPWWQISEATKTQLQENIARAAKGEFIRYEVDIWVAHQDGMTIDFSLNPVFDEEGKVILIVPEGRDVTERILAERALQASEYFSSEITSLIPDVMYLYDLVDEHMIYSNKQFADVLGYKLESITQPTYESLLHPDDISTMPSNRAKYPSLGDKEILTTEMRLKHANGTWHWFLNRMTIFKRDEEGQPRQLLGVAQDITQQKIATQALARSEALHRTLAQNLPDTSVILFDKDLRFRLVEGPLLELQGFVKEDMEGQLFYDVAQPEAIERLEPYYLATLQGISQLLEFQGPDQRHYVSHFIPIRDANHDILLGMVVARDVTKAKLAEEAIRQSEERYRTIVEHQTEMMIRYRPNGTVIFANQPYCDYYGISLDELAGSNFLDLIPNNQDRQQVEQVIGQIMSTKMYSMAERQVITSDGDVQWLLWYDQPILDNQGEVIEILAVGRDITERKLAEVALRQSEERYRIVVDNQMEMVVRYRPDGTVIFANQPYCDHLHVSFEELGGRSFLDFVHDRKKVSQTIQTVLDTKQSTTAESLYITPEGETRWHAWYDRPILDEHGKVIEILGVGRDVTERKNIEEALRRSEERYRIVIENQNELVIRHQLDFTVLFVNPAYCNEFNIPSEDVVGQNLLNFIHEESLSEVLEINATVLQSKQPFVHTHQLINGKNEFRWYEWHDQPILNEQGEVIEILTIGRDVTERVVAEQALRQSEKRYRTVVEKQAEFVSRYTPDLKLTFINQAYAKYFNVKRKKIVGKSFLKLIPEEEREAVQQRFDKVIQSKTSMTHEHQVVRADGEVRWNEWHNQPILNEQGEVVEILGIGRDVTDRKMAQEALQEAYNEMEQRVQERTAELQAANDELNAFAYSVSHDLRAPLRALSNYSLFLQEDCADDLDELGLEYVQGIAESAYEMEQLVVDLLDLSRIGRDDIEVADVDLGLLLRQVTTRLNLNGEAEVKIPEQLPTIPSKKVRLQQIFGNLISNGLKFTHPATKPCVEIEAIEQADTWDIIVRDNGIGIDDKYMEQIFGMFQRLHTSEEYPGTGIGLAIVKKAMDELGGDIRVESELGKGTQFVLTFSKV